MSIYNIFSFLFFFSNNQLVIVTWLKPTIEMSQKSSREGGILRNSSQSDKSAASTTYSALSGRTVTLSPSSSRFREKYEIKNSNNLVTYNDHDMYLEAKNSKLFRELHSSEEVPTQEVSNSLHDPYDLHHIYGLRKYSL